MCRSCHANWKPETFQHAITGLRLDEVHGGLDCDACHVEHRYDSEPTCATCHDDGRTAPALRLGRRHSIDAEPGRPEPRSMVAEGRPRLSSNRWRRR